MEAVDFFNALTGPQLLQTTEAYLPEHRERLYPPTVTLAMFMRQALDEDGSCQRAVNGWRRNAWLKGCGPTRWIPAPTVGRDRGYRWRWCRR